MPTRAVLLDALGTLVELEPPAPRLHASLGGDVPLPAVERAMRAEMDYYRRHSHEGRDPESLAELRERCAALLSDELGRPVTVATMMSAIRLRPYDDAAPALAQLGRGGLTRVCVSNWDSSLPEVLERVGLQSELDGVVTSAGVGHAKPDPAIFVAALELAGCEASEALAVGDTEAEDVAGAQAAGLRAVLLARGRRREFRMAPTPVISSLAEIGHHLRK